MGKLAKNIFYGVTFGLSAWAIIWTMLAKKANVGKAVQFGLGIMYVLIILAVVAAVVLSVKNLAHNMKSAVMFGIGVGVLILLVIIGYALDDHEVLQNYPSYGVTTAKYSGMIGGSLIATWIVLGGAVALTLFAAVSDFIKRL